MIALLRLDLFSYFIIIENYWFNPTGLSVVYDNQVSEQAVYCIDVDRFLRTPFPSPYDDTTTINSDSEFQTPSEITISARVLVHFFRLIDFCIALLLYY